MADHVRVKVSLANGKVIEFDTHIDGSYDLVASLSENGCRDEATGVLYPPELILEIEVRNPDDDEPIPDPFSVN